MKNIKLVYVNDNYTYTRINGTEKEIIDFYNFNNMTNGDINTQIKQIEIEANTVRFIGCSARTIIYPFNYNKSSECYLYE